MQRLLATVQQGRVQVIITYKLDRLPRSSRDFHHLVDVFERHGVGLVSATESIDTKSPQSRLMTYIMVQFAQYDRELDQERSKDFHLARARKGLWCGGLPPLGYDSKDKRFVVNEAEANAPRLAPRSPSAWSEKRKCPRPNLLAQEKGDFLSRMQNLTIFVRIYSWRFLEFGPLTSYMLYCILLPDGESS